MTRYSAWYDSPTPPTQETSGTVTLSSDFPRTITVASAVTCADGCDRASLTERQHAIESASEDEAQGLRDELEQDCGYDPQACDPSNETTVYAYRAGTYAVR